MTAADLRFYFSILVQRLPYLMLVCAVGTLIGGVLAFSQRPTYRATAQILVQPSEIPAELARSTVQEDAAAQVQIIKRELITREALLGLARRLKVYEGDAAVAGADKLSEADIVKDMGRRIFIEQVVLGGADRGGATAFAISFDASDRNLSAAVTNELVSTILRKDAERRSQRATDTLKFFQQDVQRLESELSALDGQLLQFKNQHLDELPDSLDFRRLRQGNQEERLLLLEREEASLNSRRANLVLLYQETGRGPTGVVQTPEGQLLASLKSALATQSAIFSKDSPTIEALQARIDAMELRGRTAQAADAAAPQDANRPMSDLDLQLADIDDRLSAISTEKVSIRASIAGLDASIQATPKNETALNVLERNRNNSQSLYNAATARLEEASTGEQIEARLKAERLSLIEAATPPQDALPSKRLLMVAGGMFGGLGLGLAVLAALELLNRRVRRPVELQRKLDIEPMLTIPYLRSSSEIWSRRATTLTAVAVIVVVLSAIPFIVSSFDTPLAAAMNGMLGRPGGGV